MLAANHDRGNIKANCSCPLVPNRETQDFHDFAPKGGKSTPRKDGHPHQLPHRTDKEHLLLELVREEIRSSPPQIRFLFEIPYLCCKHAKNAIDVRRSVRACRCPADSVARCHLQRVRGQVLVYVFVVLGDSAQRTSSHGPRQTPHLPMNMRRRANSPPPPEARDTARKRKIWKTLKNQDETTKWSLKTKCQSYRPTQANKDELGTGYFSAKMLVDLRISLCSR